MSTFERSEALARRAVASKKATVYADDALSPHIIATVLSRGTDAARLAVHVPERLLSSCPVSGAQTDPPGRPRSALGCVSAAPDAHVQSQPVEVQSDAVTSRGWGGRRVAGWPYFWDTKILAKWCTRTYTRVRRRAPLRFLCLRGSDPCRVAAALFTCPPAAAYRQHGPVPGAVSDMCANHMTDL